MANILFIDDNEDFRLVIETVLSRAGHTVTTASSGEEGLSCFQGGGFDLVITDILMPGKSGIEIIHDLAAKSPSTRIIAISGGFLGGANSGDSLAETLGVACTIGKPFVPEELLKAVSDTLSGAAPARVQTV